MRKTKGSVPDAMVLEGVQALRMTGPNQLKYHTRDVFAIDRQSGLWRRVPRKPGGKRATTTLAFWDGVVVELARDYFLEGEVRQALLLGPVSSERPAVPPVSDESVPAESL